MDGRNEISYSEGTIHCWTKHSSVDSIIGCSVTLLLLCVMTGTGDRFGMRNAEVVGFNRQHEASAREIWVQDKGTTE